MRGAWTRRVALGLLVVLSVTVLAFLAVSRPATGTSTTVPAPPPAAAPDAVAEGELWLAEMDLSSSDVLTADGRLRDVRMQADDVLLGAGGLRAGSLTVDAVVPFDVVAEQVGPRTTIEPAGRGEARVTRTVTLLGRAVDLAASGTVRAEDGQVVMVPTSVDVGGPGWLSDAVGGVAARFVTIRQDVEGLPPDLVLEDVDVASEGFAVRLTGRDVVLGG